MRYLRYNSTGQKACSKMYHFSCKKNWGSTSAAHFRYVCISGAFSVWTHRNSSINDSTNEHHIEEVFEYTEHDMQTLQVITSRQEHSVDALDVDREIHRHHPITLLGQKLKGANVIPVAGAEPGAVQEEDIPRSRHHAGRRIAGCAHEPHSVPANVNGPYLRVLCKTHIYHVYTGSGG